MTLLYFDDCPNWLDADQHLKAVAREVPGLVVHRRVVDTAEEAERTGFRGSPSIQVDGVDLFAESDAPVGLACRVYQTPDGLAGSPTLDQLREALAAHHRGGSREESDLVAMLADAGTAPPRAVAAVQRLGLEALIRGSVASVADIADGAGLSLEEIREGIDGLVGAGRIELDEDSVIGVAGLTVTPTIHQIDLPEASRHTWCALDAVGIPVALDLDATVTTSCPHCGKQLVVTVRDGEATSGHPVVLFCPTGACDNVRADFCAAANLFCSSDHLSAWRDDNPGTQGTELDLDATVELGRVMWAPHRTIVDDRASK